MWVDLTVSCKESDGGSLTTSTRRAADAVDIVLRVVRVVVVEHVSDVLDVFDAHTISIIIGLKSKCFDGSNSNPLPDARSVWVLRSFATSLMQPPPKSEEPCDARSVHIYIPWSRAVIKFSVGKDFLGNARSCDTNATFIRLMWYHISTGQVQKQSAERRGQA